MSLSYIIGDAGGRADQRISIGQMGNGTMHLALDAEFGKNRHAVQGIVQLGHDPFIVGVKQFVLGFPRAMIFPDSIGIFLLINADQVGFLLHADIAGDQLVIVDNWQFGRQVGKFRHRFGNEIMVGHGGHRQLQPAPFTHLASIGSVGIDHVLTDDIALFGRDFPFAALQLNDIGGAAAADNFGAQITGTNCHGLRHT